MRGSEGIVKMIRSCVFILLACICLAAVARAAEDERYVCPAGSLCMVHKVDYGAVEVHCSDGLGDTAEVWVCEYELGYACSRRSDGTSRSGGALPSWSHVCSHLCAKCPQGWSKAVDVR